MTSLGHCHPCHPERSEGSLFPYHPSLKSFHRGLTDSINAIFFDLSHPLICFSRERAAETSWVSSKYTSLVMLYLEENPGVRFCLCSYTRRSRLLVTPA